jgi:transcriptional regulator with AAA-type ATPase domain
VRKAREDSPLALGPSNSLLGLVAEACRTAGSSRGERSALERILALAVLATRTERAFVLRADASIEAYHGPPDRCSSPSRTAVRLAVGRDRALIRPDLTTGDRLLAGESVRGLALRCVLATIVPHVAPSRVLLLDGRAPAGIQVAEALDAFAAVVGWTLSAWPLAAAPTIEAVRSTSMVEALAWADRAARTELPILVRGETGSGKERFARRIHLHSRRPTGPLLAINCAAVPETLLEGELFGSARGAYTGADRDRVGLFRQAHGGTLFLDEIGEMTQAMQAKLLRALEERRVRPIGGATEIEVDARLVAATHRDLSALVEQGAFRSDLFHRLAVLEVLVPPLRERIEDLRPLVTELAPPLARETGCALPRLEDDAWRALEAHDWPGNVRELRSVLARAMLRAGSEPIAARHLGALASPVEARAGRARETLERRMILEALDRAEGVVAHAARRIGWSRQKLARRMRATGVSR